MSRSGRQRGLTLVEAMITLLVMSVGLLGMAALQMIGVQENASAMRHSQAIWFAYDMADRMRANLNYGAAAPPWPVAPEDRADHYDGIDVSEGVAATGQTCANTCNVTQMRNFDADQWRALVIGLPNGRGTVTEDPNADGRYYVRVMWDDDGRTGVNTTGCPSDASIAQTCVEIMVEP
jgi:type IV pilus assembly protein PilV